MSVDDVNNLRKGICHARISVLHDFLQSLLVLEIQMLFSDKTSDTLLSPRKRVLVKCRGTSTFLW